MIGRIGGDPSRISPELHGPDERWLTVGSAEEPDGVELVLHLADELARAFRQAS
jgi:hypothetical protein